MGKSTAGAGHSHKSYPRTDVGDNVPPGHPQAYIGRYRCLPDDEKTALYRAKRPAWTRKSLLLPNNEGTTVKSLGQRGLLECLYPPRRGLPLTKARAEVLTR